ncbi:hypothetical protein [Pseudomonas nitroreducens]|uniref:Uncharacterized protein n=1 Tax=Pseudomonas nitroreducens TaxID=46680 RepID=A0A246F872_PSENT|nr:hypothetical protein [Pseudomonas nitroreducens]OWP49783.1 hypothetical protein CEG18_15185 [Pseudomonas nitroreducens]
MAVDLRALPEPLPHPSSPGGGRWLLIILTGVIAGGLLVTLFWPGSGRGASLWFWCCAVVFPLMAGLLAYALRRQVAEGRMDYVEGWNQARDERRLALVEQGQQHLLLIAAACCSAAGNNKLAQALRSGIVPLQPCYVPSHGATLRLSQLQPAVASLSADEYAERLSGYLREVLLGLGAAWHTCAQHITHVRIRHNGVLADEQVLAVWRAVAGDQHRAGQTVFASQADDGLVWLDDWLDAPERAELLLSLEFNGYREPEDGYAESVSAVLLGRPDCANRQKLSPLAAVHRPVRASSPAESFEDALRWGGLLDTEDTYFFWQSQVSDEVAEEMARVMSQSAYPPSHERSLNLDSVLGRSGCAVGNLALVVAGEQAMADREAQLILLEDVTPQWCVVRPVGAPVHRDVTET